MKFTKHDAQSLQKVLNEDQKKTEMSAAIKRLASETFAKMYK